jgi:hypothetical protein
VPMLQEVRMGWIQAIRRARTRKPQMVLTSKIRLSKALLLLRVRLSDAPWRSTSSECLYRCTPVCLKQYQH